MKVIYTERLQTKLALNRKKYCPGCGNHEYTIVQLLDPLYINKLEEQPAWSVRCLECGYETFPFWVKKHAIRAWKDINT